MWINSLTHPAIMAYQSQQMRPEYGTRLHYDNVEVIPAVHTPNANTKSEEVPSFSVPQGNFIDIHV